MAFDISMNLRTVHSNYDICTISLNCSILTEEMYIMSPFQLLRNNSALPLQLQILSNMLN